MSGPRIIVAGSRTFFNAALLWKTMEQVRAKYPGMIVICGGARGADSLGKAWANVHGVPVEMFIPDWEKHGKKAGILRNEEMAEVADHLVAFWDGESRGTKHMIDAARRRGLGVWVIDAG